MAQSGREQMFFKILVFFAIITAITGTLNMANAGTITLGDFGSSEYMQTIPGQASPNVGVSLGGSDSGTTTYGTQDYTTSTGYNHNLTTSSSSLGSDMFVRSDGIGFMSSFVPVQYPNIAYLDVAGGSANNNIYDYIYHVYNTFSGYPFYTIVSGSEGGNGFISGFLIKYDVNSVSIVNSNDINNPIQSFSYPYSNQAQTVETVFDATAGAVAVYVDDNYVGTFSSVSYGGNTLGAGTGGASSSSGVYYVGVAASHYGMEVSSIDGTFVADNPVSWWDSVMDKVNGLVIFGSMFLSLLGTMTGLTSNALVPFWLWAIIGIPCIATLILIYLEIARGD